MARQSFESASFDDDEKPLDPAVLRVQARLRRLMLIAGLTLGLGIFAVFGAILYRIVTMDTTARTPAVTTVAKDAGLGLPAGAKLVSTALDGDRLALTFETADGTEVVVIDIRNGGTISRLKLAP